MEIISIIRNLKCKNSTGYDGISSTVLKQIAQGLATPLSILINRSIAEGVFPQELKLAKLIPLYKNKEQLID